MHLLFSRYPRFLLLSLALFKVNTTVAIVYLVTLFIFFRNPDRVSLIHSSDEVVAAADGTILEIHDDGKTIRVCTFLSLLDVHVQYAPVDGIVIRQTHKPGEFHPAYIMEKSLYNERLTTDILCNNGQDVISVVQIAGQLAQRIDSFISQGQQVTKGCKFGMILFGSRVDVIVPSGRYVPLVKKGQHVAAGITTMFKARRQRF